MASWDDTVLEWGDGYRRHPSPDSSAARLILPDGPAAPTSSRSGGAAALPIREQLAFAEFDTASYYMRLADAHLKSAYRLLGKDET